MVGTTGFELEPSCGRLSPQAKSRAQPIVDSAPGGRDPSKRMVGTTGFELEPSCGRLSPQAKSRAQPIVDSAPGGRDLSKRMVGTTGFEPATSRTPSVRATRLRYVPTDTPTATGQRNQKAESGEGISTSKVSPPFEQRQECAERIAQIEQHLAAQKLPGP